MGFFDIGTDKREKVQKVRAKERKEQLKLNREIKVAARRERRAEFERKKLESQTKTARARERKYEADLARKQAKRAASPFPTISFASPKIRKKKQGRKLSRRSPIRII